MKKDMGVQGFILEGFWVEEIKGFRGGMMDIWIIIALIKGYNKDIRNYF